MKNKMIKIMKKINSNLNAVPLIIIMIVITKFLIHIPGNYYQRDDERRYGEIRREAYHLNDVAYEAVFANKCDSIENYECIANSVTERKMNSYELHNCSMNLSRECSKVLAGTWVDKIADVFDKNWQDISVYDVNVAFIEGGTVSTFTVSVCKVYDVKNMLQLCIIFEKDTNRLFMVNISKNYTDIDAEDYPQQEDLTKQNDYMEDYAKSAKLMEEYYGIEFEYQRSLFTINEYGAIATPFSKYGRATAAYDAITGKIAAMY